MLDLLTSLITYHGLHTPSNILVSAQGLFSYELHLYDNTSNMGVRGGGGIFLLVKLGFDRVVRYKTKEYY